MKPIYEIPGYEQHKGYYVTEYGEIYSKITNKFLKQSVRGGYCRITLGPKKVKKSYSVHRLVALAYLYFDGCENLTVNHKDEITTNNNKNNLEWLSIRDNVRYSQAKSKTFDNPEKILEEWNTSSLSLREFSNQYNVSLNTMWDTINISAKGENLRKRRKFDKAERLLIAKDRADGKLVAEVAKLHNCAPSMVSKVYGEYIRGELNELS